MIYIKSNESFEKVENWEELLKRENFHSPVDMAGKKLLDAFGYYELSHKVPCGKSSCRKAHAKGILVITEDGSETNIGHDCGFAAFGVKFEQMAALITNQAKYHMLLDEVKSAKKDLLRYHLLKLKLEQGPPTLESLAHKIIDAQSSRVIGRSAYIALKSMAATNNGKVKITRTRKINDKGISHAISNKLTDDKDELVDSNRTEYYDEMLGNVQYTDCLLSDYNIAIVYERDILTVLQELYKCKPDEMHQKSLVRLGVKVSRLNERFSFIESRILRAKMFLTQQNLKPLLIKLHLQKNVSQKDKNLFKNFVKSLPEENH